MKKMEEEKKRKQEELKRFMLNLFYKLCINQTDDFSFFFNTFICYRKRDERLRKVFEAKVKEEQREEQKKKKIEQKMAQIDEKNDKVREHVR